ncbi:dual specificity protein phosphatase [Bodo saltans virus]|uniref:Dual specificity protein phosphatase n=1 Tax=Bodo saltans virus TaxID=2024608 RepID=A0A2H4UUI0_9VIRU|nr:dual specificity protein phosphatase [Bodo saltans virus]ATZ80580.1 dual specificity protein phosphatase [Bodo saltans virus]
MNSIFSDYTKITESEYYKSAEEYVLWGYGKILTYTQPTINQITASKFDINKVCDCVYIGDFSSACNTDELKKIGITHIVTAIIGVEPMYPDKFTYHVVDITDRSHSEINKHFDECSDFIDNCVKNNGKVLVHCKYGVSRSATLIAAYLIRKQNYTTNSAINLIQKSRTQIKPNDGFVLQLKNYEKMQKNKNE